jgi:hypothetical protein
MQDGASPPILILAPPGSKGSLLAAALGRHPDLFAAPHLNLLAFESTRQLLQFARVPRDVHVHGLVRMLSWLLVEEQSIEGVQAAYRWLAQRRESKTSVVYSAIRGRLQPMRLVEYSPLYSYHRAVIERVVAAAPDATFIHLIRHPTTTAGEIARAAAQSLKAAIGYWTNYDFDHPSMDLVQLTDTLIDWECDPPAFDPQYMWYRSHRSIVSVLAALPEEQVIRVRVEDLLGNPQTTLGSLCRALGARATRQAIGDMLRTEDSIFSGPGPYGSPGGVDFDFVAHPAFPEAEALPSMDGELPWRGDGGGYRSQVIALAGQFGYRSSGLLGRSSLPGILQIQAPNPRRVANSR